MQRARRHPIAPSTSWPNPTQAAAPRRPLLSPEDGRNLASLFKLFASETRLRLLHVLARAGEVCVTDLADAVDMKPQAVSNQLQRLVDRRALGYTRRGMRVYYQIVDPCVGHLLEYGLCLNDDARVRQPRRDSDDPGMRRAGRTQRGSGR